MSSKIIFLTICILLLLGFTFSIPPPVLNVFDVTRYGIIPDDRTDIAQVNSKHLLY